MGGYLLYSALMVAVAPLDSAGLKSVAVMPTSTRGKVAVDVARVLDDLVLSALQKHAPKLRFIGKADIDAQLGLERMKDALGCDEIACAAELAGALGVDAVLTVSLGALGKKHMLSLSLLASKGSQVLARHSENLGSDVETFDDGIDKAVRALLGVQPGATEVAPAPAASCGKEGTLRSLDAKRPTRIVITNRRATAVHLFWLDYGGQRKHYATLAAGQAIPMDTFHTHPWLVADMAGACQGIALPEAMAQGRFDIVDALP